MAEAFSIVERKSPAMPNHVLAVESFPPEARSVGDARRFVRSTFRGLAADDAVETAVLLTSELVTNAVLHACSIVQVVLTNPRGALRAAVSDSSPHMPVVKPVSGSSGESGRGLQLIDRLAEKWGVEVGHPGKTVWFRVRAARSPRVGRDPEGQTTPPG
jgi:anti-sigma regulatory factor (Ser/Thr protein kinase)